MATPAAKLPECLMHAQNYDACQKIAQAFMFLVTEIPQLTQRGDREMSFWKVHKMSESSSSRMREVFAFLMTVLQDLQDSISNHSGLLNQADLSHQGNRHAERDLRQLRLGLTQSLAMCRNLTEQIAYEATKATRERSPHLLAEMRALSDAVLAQLTLISERVNRRVQELSTMPQLCFESRCADGV